MIEWIILAVLLILLIYLFLQYSKLQGEIETRARKMLEEWKATELNDKVKLLFENWKREEERKIRENAIKRSEMVIKGKVIEHLIPFFPEFRYNPKDARFVGSPVDLVIFDGLSEGKLRKIVFAEVKTGKSDLSNRERLVKQCIESKKVVYETIYYKNYFKGV
jgi:predicted Holliday junction resolvase-like endonuclease